MKHFFCSAIMMMLAVAAGAAPAGEWRDLSGQAGHSAGFVLADGEFPSGANGWKGIDGKAIRVVPNAGVNGSPALCYERTDPAKYTLVSRSLPLKAGGAYRFGGVFRNEGVRGGGASIIVELYDAQGKWLRNVECPTSADKECGWTPMEYNIAVAPAEKDCSFVIHLLMPRGATGKVWFDHVFVEELGPQWKFQQVYPTHNLIDADGGVLRFFSRLKGNFRLPEGVKLSPGQAVEFKLETAGRTVERTVPVEGQVAETELPALPEGEGMLTARLLDPVNRLILAEKKSPVKIRKRFGKTLPGNCVIDARGRAIVDGKPYMPLGLYTGVLKRKDVERIAASPFNCVMPYGSMHLAPDGEASGDGLPLEQVKLALDELHANGLKILFSIKDVYRSNPLGPDDYSYRGLKGADETAKRYVEAFRRHPALLAWYTCDEKMVDWVEIMTRRRELVNRLDPDHPTWAVFYQPNVEDYLPMLDIFGGDQYPISRISEGYDHHMTSIDRLMGLAEATGVPTWNVPQAHNLNIYAPADKAADYRDPTGKEMLALALVQAIHGGKGFIFYSYFDFPRGPAGSEASPELAEKRWRNACMAAGELKKLEPFLMAEQDGPVAETVKSEGRFRVRCFTDGAGNYRLLLAGVGPGRTSGTVRVKLPENLTFRSRFGNTEQAAPGEFRFEGNDIACDIVELDRK